MIAPLPYHRHLCPGIVSAPSAHLFVFFHLMFIHCHCHLICCVHLLCLLISIFVFIHHDHILLLLFLLYPLVILDLFWFIARLAFLVHLVLEERPWFCYCLFFFFFSVGSVLCDFVVFPLQSTTKRSHST